MANDIIEWQKDGTPRSALYDDIYFSTDNGLLESRAVFLDGIDAPEVWQGRNKFTICELGFGTGLNFLNTLKLWMENSGPDQTLNYFAIELYPLSEQQISRAVHWPQLEAYKNEFLNHYSARKFTLYDGRVSFHLLCGECSECLQKFEAKIDAWYMDGFAPHKNPEMWRDEIFFHMARLSNDGAKMATFTAAGFVRRGLSAANFQMTKRSGFGKKREMLSGKLVKKTESVAKM